MKPLVPPFKPLACLEAPSVPFKGLQALEALEAPLQALEASLEALEASLDLRRNVEERLQEDAKGVLKRVGKWQKAGDFVRGSSGGAHPPPTRGGLGGGGAPRMSLCKIPKKPLNLLKEGLKGQKGDLVVLEDFFSALWR